MAKLSVSIVIPAYNEESQIAACLEAVSRQTVKPLEVIVVDNNSTDRTAAIARRYPFVTLIREKRQGVMFARAAGMNAARGDIIGRIDGDTRIDPDWVEKVQEIFADGSVAVATGRVRYTDMVLARAASAIDLAARRYLASRLRREVAIQGANMAIRRSAWRSVRKDLCRRGGIHEDYDIAIHVTWQNGLVVFDERMVATLGYRLADNSYREFRDYCYTSPRTYFQHGLFSGREMYPVVWMVLFFYLPLKFLRRGYDNKTGSFSLRQALTTATDHRVNPVTYGDF